MDTNLIKDMLNETYEKHKSISEGKNADYIPYLAKVDSSLCSMSIVTTDGDVISIGDDTFRFAIESISKICTLALALEEKGADAVMRKIGNSPTGLSFNSIMALELHKGKPLSPLVNAGAMSTTSIIEAKDREERFEKILSMQRKLMSEKILLSEEVNESEQTTNFHNRAIAYLLYSAGYMYSDPMQACEVYTKQCSTLVSSIDLATLAGTLANRGINPITKKMAISEKNVPHILSAMMMEGLYDSSGEFAYTVGLPGKSGVGGGLLVVVPNVMGIATFSPPLDVVGNSVRGQKMIRYFANKMGFNIFN